MTIQEQLLPLPQSDLGDEIQAALAHTSETQQQIPEGFSYQQFDTGRRFPVSVMVFRQGDKSTYLIPITDDPERYKDKIDAVSETVSSIRLLPVGEDMYSDTEKSLFQDLVVSGHQLGQPLVHEHSTEALVFDPRSVKSLLDVMIATGHDTTEIRKERLAALHGEQTETTRTLNYLELLTHHEDPRATALNDVFNFDHRIYSEELIEKLITTGFDSFLFTRAHSRLDAGVNPKLVEHTVTEPEQLQAIVTEAWKELIAVAKEKNTDLQIYTELHKIGKVIIPVPAIASTAWI